MTIPSRNSLPSSIQESLRTFFVTTSAFVRKNILQSEAKASLLVEVMFAYRSQGKYLLHDFVVMPDHIHFLITVDGSTSIEKAVQLIKGGFSYRVKKELGLNAEVWQKGFSEKRIHSLEEFSEYRRYIRMNPVKRGLVRVDSDFKYSSANAGFAVDAAPENLRG